ncbi:unnamed protein product, partial [Meganyctiphanes norvegica]
VVVSLVAAAEAVSRELLLLSLSTPPPRRNKTAAVTATAAAATATTEHIYTQKHRDHHIHLLHIHNRCGSCDGEGLRRCCRAPPRRQRVRRRPRLGDSRLPQSRSHTSH